MRKLVLCVVLIAGCQESITDMSARLDKLEAKTQESLDSYNANNKLWILYGLSGDKIRAAVEREQAAKSKAEYEAGEKACKVLRERLLRRVGSQDRKRP